MRYPMKHLCHLLLAILSLLIFFNSQIFAADGYTDLILQVKDPLKRELCVRGEIKDNEGNTKYVYPKIYHFIYSEGLHSWKFDGLPQYTNIILNIYEGNDCNGQSIGSITIELHPRNHNEIIIDNLNDILGTNPVITPNTGNKTVYYQKIQAIMADLDPNKTWPFGDMDPNFPPGGDYDGDGISNLDEVMIYLSYPHYPTIPLPLLKGLNLFYFPSVSSKLNIISGKAQNIINPICYYEPSTKTWEDAPLYCFIVPNTFNAIDASAAGMLFLDLIEEPSIPVLWLKGFLSPSDPCGGSHPSCCLSTSLLDPNCLKANTSISEIFINPNPPEIEETICRQGFLDGKWECSYPFFGRLMGQEKRIDPYGVYIIRKSSYH